MYIICAFVGPVAVLEQISTNHQNAFVVPLQQGFGLIPITPSFQQEIQHKDGDSVHGFYQLTTTLAEVGVNASLSGALAYIEAEMFGGEGRQSAIAWRNGETTMFSHEIGAVSSILRNIGVQAGAAFDEFQALELGKYRETERWLAELKD